MGITETEVSGYSLLHFERNNRLFNRKYHSADYCMKLIARDFIIWTCISVRREEAPPIR